MQYNARRPGGSGTALDIARAENKTGVDFRLTPHGVVTGKITDEDGDPLEGVQVQIMRLVYNQGRKQLQQHGGESTNDLGEFRLSGIAPGKYYLCAIYRNRMAILGAVERAEDSAQEDYVTTFFPGATDISAASPFEIGPGDQVQGLNIRLTKTHTVRVSGRVVDGNPRIQLRLQPRNALNPNGLMITTQVKIDGTFEFPSVAPGPYNLIALSTQGGRAGARAARQPLDVGGNNIEGINLAITPGATVTGHVRYDGDPPQPLPSLTVRLTPRELTIGTSAPQPAKVDGDGNFRFDDVNLDQYNVTINTPLKLYLKSLRAGSTDVMVSGLDLSNGAATLDILMGLNPPQVGGAELRNRAACRGRHRGFDAPREGTAGRELLLLHHQHRPIRQFQLPPRDAGRIPGLRLGRRGIRPVVRS